MKHSLVVIDTFTVLPNKVAVSFQNKEGLWGEVAIVSEKGYDFSSVSEQEKAFLKDTLIMYACSEVAPVSDKVIVNVQVTAFIALTLQNFLSKMFSWISYFSNTEAVCPIEFNLVTGDSGTGFTYTPEENSAIIGWSRGKESIASYEMAKEAGYKVTKATFNKPVDENDDAEFSLRIDGNIFIDATDVYSVFKKGYFDYQGYICLPLFAMLLLQGKRDKVSTLFVGSEYGTSDVFTKDGKEFLDLAADESWETAMYFSLWLKHSYDLEIQVNSPVATLTEVGILRYILSKGYKYTDLESCWHYSALNGTNCESCLKCNRLKIYGHYLIDRGYLDSEDFYNAFVTDDFPDIANPMLITYSMASEVFISDILRNDKTIDWADVWIDHDRDVMFSGKCIEVVKKYFNRLPFEQAQVHNPRIDVKPQEQVIKECVRYLGENYQTLLKGLLPVIAITDILLPLEHEIFKETPMPFTVLSYFSKWVVYDKQTPVAVVEPLGLDIPRLKQNRTYETKSPIVKIWLQKDNIEQLLNRSNIEYDIKPYLNEQVHE